MAQINNIQKHLLPIVTKSNTRIILDLKNVHHMDCCAANCLIALSRIARTNHSTLALRNLNENVKLLAKTLKLSQILDIDYRNKRNIIAKYS